MIELNKDYEQSLISLKDSGVTCKPGEAASTSLDVSCVSAASRSRDWAKTRHVTTDAMQEV